MSKSLSWASTGPPPFGVTVLYLAAAVLRAASNTLDRVAARAAARQADRLLRVHTVEFHALHAEAGAPEGALYINGEFAGVIEGVKRL